MKKTVNKIRTGEDDPEKLIREKGPCPETYKQFRKIILDHYSKHGRALHWRKDPSPYNVFVSEIMLQQTQVDRVAAKYTSFIERFQDFAALGSASVKDVLEEWQGMGYNRRALALKKSALIIVEKHGGKLPSSEEELLSLPGIGPATAASIRAFAFNEPVVFIETNIRSVFIHFFFGDEGPVPDSEILPLVELTMDRKNPRQWYNALMDYGTKLKSEQNNPGRRSAHYGKQAPFQGSNRQKRGAVLRIILSGGRLSPEVVARRTGLDKKTANDVLKELAGEGFVREEKGKYCVREK